MYTPAVASDPYTAATSTPMLEVSHPQKEIVAKDLSPPCTLMWQPLDIPGCGFDAGKLLLPS